jgi:hypothetical protein
VDELGRGDVEGRVESARRDLGGIALLDRDGGARRCGRIDRRQRGGDVERDVVARGEDGQRIGPDLVRDVSVRGDPVGAHDDAVDRTGGEQRAGR